MCQDVLVMFDVFVCCRDFLRVRNITDGSRLDQSTKCSRGIESAHSHVAYLGLHTTGSPENYPTDIRMLRNRETDIGYVQLTPVFK